MNAYTLGEEPAAPSDQDFGKLLESVLSREKTLKDKWHDKVKDIYETYEGGKQDETPFNILYSNTEILVPNIFSSAPKPLVRRRFGEIRADNAAQAAERMAEYCMDTNLSGYPDFVDAIESCVMDAALPGQGQARVRLVDGTACIDYVQHTHFIWGYAKRWEDVPWIAYRHDKTKKDAVREFGLDELRAAQMQEPADESSQAGMRDKGPSTIAIYEVWNKVDKKVYFLTDSLPDRLVQELEDPLGLRGFFPSEKPLRLLSTPCSTMPRALYGLYKKQALELNLVTLRIKKITEAIKVRGIYDGAMPEMQQLFDNHDSENTLVPGTSQAVLTMDGGLDKRIWMVPIEKYVVVLRELYAVREQIKSTIYEILGIGDILRGVSAASETASAQQIKDKWGSLRIKKSREKVSTFVRTYIRLLIEVSAKHTPEPVWSQVTGLPFVQTEQIATMPPPMQGVEPPILWGQVLEQLQNDLTRSYIVDIETNSTVDGDATEEKAEATEFMTAFAQAMQGLGPLAMEGPEGFEAAKLILTEVCKRFRMGNELVAVLGKLKPQPKGLTPEQQAKEDDLKQVEEQVKQAQAQADSTMQAVKDQFTQQKDQISQMVESLKNQQSTLEKAMLEQQAQTQALDAREAELDLKEASIELVAREAQVKIAETAHGVAKDHVERDLQYRQRALDDQAQMAEESAETAQAGEADKASNAVLTAVQEQSKLFEAILEKMGKPVKIVKTGPGTFERVTS